MNELMSKKVREALNDPKTRDLVMEAYLRRRSRPTADDAERKARDEGPREDRRQCGPAR